MEHEVGRDIIIKNFANGSSRVKLFGSAHSCFTFVIHNILAYWKGEE